MCAQNDGQKIYCNYSNMKKCLNHFQKSLDAAWPLLSPFRNYIYFENFFAYSGYFTESIYYIELKYIKPKVNIFRTVVSFFIKCLRSLRKGINKQLRGSEKKLCCTKSYKKM